MSATSLGTVWVSMCLVSGAMPDGLPAATFAKVSMASVLYDTVLVGLVDCPLDAAQHRVLDGAAEISQEAADAHQVFVLGFERLEDAGQRLRDAALLVRLFRRGGEDLRQHVGVGVQGVVDVGEAENDGFHIVFDLVDPVVVGHRRGLQKPVLHRRYMDCRTLRIAVRPILWSILPDPAYATVTFMSRNCYDWRHG